MDLVAEGAGLVAQGSSTDTTAVEIDYVNWRGERAPRRIVPQRLYFAAVAWHPEEQWILDGWDIDKQCIRSFAMKDIHAWLPADAQATR